MISAFHWRRIGAQLLALLAGTAAMLFLIPLSCAAQNMMNDKHNASISSWSTAPLPMVPVGHR
ncbi:hypothetical protein ACTOWA_11910 [Herbaspirillum seropedicae]|uniref:hypothetical protein n=1 Tax=Herbaspirillum seropedicae TaxID=964 RepID=UPI003F8D41C5